MAIIKVSVIDTDTRWAKEIRIFGIPVYLYRVLNLKEKETPVPSRIGFHVIGNNSNIETGGKKQE